MSKKPPGDIRDNYFPWQIRPGEQVIGTAPALPWRVVDETGALGVCWMELLRRYEFETAVPLKDLLPMFPGCGRRENVTLVAKKWKRFKKYGMIRPRYGMIDGQGAGRIDRQYGR